MRRNSVDAPQLPGFAFGELFRTILVLTGSQDPLVLLRTIAGTVCRADGPLEAADALTRLRPDVIVVEPGVGWHGSFIEHIPRATRPAVVAIGEGAVRGSIADEWIRSVSIADEVTARLRLGWERARERRHKCRQVFTDLLTGLPNRRAVIRALVFELHRRKREETQVGLVLLDLDDFKEVNERFGHAAGDRLLRRVGNTLRRATRSSELCGRVGGDEFALVLEGDTLTASRAAERLCAALVPVGVSTTTAVGTLRDGEQLRGLYRRIDDALRAAKRRRRASLEIPPRSDIRAAG